jgi:WD40 repeat protein
MSQSIDLVWPLGIGANPMANLNFTSGSMVVDTDYHIMQFSTTNSSIADSSGNLIMYSNGCFIANALDDTMMNGSGLNPDTCVTDQCGHGNIITQGNLVLGIPASNRYYLFHQDCNYSNGGGPGKLYYSIIDLSLDSGRGGVTSKNTILFQGPMCDGLMTSVLHADGLSWWVLLHKRNSDEFVEFLVSPSGIQGPYLQSIGPSFNDDSKGNSKFSPDGRRFVTTTEGSNIHIFDFNRCTGLLSNYEFIPNPYPSIVIASIEFSPSSRFLYYILSQNIYQYDMLSSNIASSALIVATYDGFIDVLPTIFSVPQLAQDKKIYISSGSTRYFHVINYPDSLGTSSSVSQHSISLPCLNYVTVPSLPNYHLSALSPAYCDSINIVFELTTEQIRIIPNPCTDILKIDFSKELTRLSSLRIYNAMGQLFIQHKVFPQSNEIFVDVSQLPVGSYFMILENEKAVTRQSFVKM